MRRAKKEVRLMGIASYGYIYRVAEDGKKFIAVKEPEASNMSWAFTELSKGVFNASQIMEMMVRRGGKRIRVSALLAALRNPAYCGKIFVEKYNDEEAHFVTSIHEALIIEILRLAEVRESIKKYLRKLLLQNFKEFVNNPVSDKRKIISEIEVLQNRLKQARNKLLEEVIDDEEYSEIKQDCKMQIDKLEKRLAKVDVRKKVDLPKLVDRAIESIGNLAKLYVEGDIVIKRKIIGSTFPEKLAFHENAGRTARPNILLSFILQINSELESQKNRRKSELLPLSGLVPITEEISKHLVEDLERIVELNNPVM